MSGLLHLKFDSEALAWTHKPISLLSVGGLRQTTDSLQARTL